MSVADTATFSAIEEALGVDWARSARDAAKLGGSAVLKLLAPHLPAGTQQMKVARDLADAYAKWSVGQPPPTDGGLGKAEQFTFDAGELLPRRFTLTTLWSRRTRRSAVYFLWHFP